MHLFIFQGKLTKKFRVQGIPKLVLIDGENGKTITVDGYTYTHRHERNSKSQL
jgi:thioredoxin-related protein